MTRCIMNHSKARTEKATQETCPRCKGFGALRSDIDNCPLCNGRGRLWLTESGWTLKISGRVNSQEKLY